MADYRDRILECYIYFYHMDEWFKLPQYPESITDAMQSTFSQQNALARTAPVFSYSNSGPRSLTVNLNLHRDMLNDLNKNNASIKTFNYENVQQQLNVKNPIAISELTNARVPLEFTTDDYVDLLIKKLQAVALPSYDTSNKEVDPPRILLRFGDEIFIKGVVNSGINVTYKLPIIEYKGQHKYANVDISFTIYETDPFDAQSATKYGSFRAITTPNSMNRS